MPVDFFIFLCYNKSRKQCGRKEIENMNQESFSFVVYIIHACAGKWGILPLEVYRKMKRAECIDRYLIPFYDILHTQGTGYLVDDVKEYLENRGVMI